MPRAIFGLLLAAIVLTGSVALAQDDPATTIEDDPAAALQAPAATITDDPLSAIGDKPAATIENDPAAAIAGSPASPAAPQPATTPVTPTDTAMAVRQVFTTHCARCHQDGMLVGREKPAGGFGYILDLDALARNPEYVQFGNPSNSQVYSRVLNGSMPKDMDYVSIFGPSAEEMKTIAAWIDSLAATAGAAVASRSFIEDEALVRTIGDDLSQLSDFERPRVRYFTLTHLYNAGDTDEEMEIYRQALAKLVNSLSTESGIVVPVSVDPEKTVYRVDITDLGWDAALWRRVESFNPYFIEYDTPIMQFLQAETRTRAPVVRADWFAFVAAQPPLYYDLLSLPATKQELEKKLGIDVARNQANLQIARAGFQQSGVSRNNRMIERHSLSTGAYWESFDFAGNKERQSFFLFPLGPQYAFGQFSDQFGFVHDGGEIIFSLPNGLQGYYLTDAKGNRLDTGPTNIVQDPSRRDTAVTDGISCMSCHDQGMQLKEDQVRDYVLSHVAFPKEVRQVVEEIFPAKEDFDRLLQEDLQRFVGALKAAGVDPNLKLSGEEIVSALFQRFERDLTMRQAAAELGYSVEEFEKRLDMGGAATYALKQRLSFNLMPRDQFVELFVDLVNEISDHHAFDLREGQVAGYEDNQSYPATTQNPQSTKRFDLALYPNENDFRVGTEISFSVKPELDCHLTLINVDEKGKTTVLFPNRFNQNNQILAGRTYSVPSAEIGGFKLIFRDPGKETVIGKCNATDPGIAGVEHDFAREAFTTFDYEDYVTRSVANRAIEVVDDDAAAPVPRPRPGSDELTGAYDPHVDVIAEQGVVMEVRAH